MKVTLYILVFVLSSPLRTFAQCPEGCYCHALNPERSQHSVICRGLNLRSVPGNFPPTTIHLDLGDNIISQLRVGDFDGLGQLLNLYLQNNKITRIEPGTFQQLGNLKLLDIYDNNIQIFLNGTFEGLGKLRQLDAYNIGLRSIENDTFSPLQSTTIINLDQNKLTELASGTFKDLPLLTRLSIRGNVLTAVRHKALDNLPRLAYLHFGENKIQTVEENAFHQVGNLRALFFEDNDYTCDCESLWLWELLLSRKALGPGPRCERPEELSSTSLQFIIQEDQLCPLPEVKIRLSRRYVFPGDTVNLTCLSSGILKPSLHWSLNGKKVSSRKGFSFERDKLVIRNITVGLQGNYYCAASGTDGGVAANGIEVYLSGVGINAPTFDETETIMRTVFEGENVEFTCEPRLDTTEGLNISWSRTDALPLPEGHIVTAENSLMLLNVMTADEATYRCTAVNVLGTAFLDYQLEVERPVASRAPVIDKTNGSLLLTFSRGDRGVINCFVMSDSDFTIDWFLDGWPIRDALFTTEFQLANERQTLIITSADLRSIGDYMCLVRNEAGTNRLLARVDVTVDPYFETQPSDIGVPPTKASQFYCSAGGNPKPTIKWFFISNKTGEEREIKTSGDVFVSDERLIIVHTRSSDEGFYYCRATSDLGTVTSRRSFLTVYSVPTFTTNLPTEVNVEEPSAVRLPCTASGVPVPLVSWTKNGAVVGEQEGATIRKEQSGTLFFQNTARDNEGLYTCRVANAAGEQFHSVRLNVLRKPVAQVAPKLITVEVDEAVRFTCVTDGTPVPDINWDFKGRPVTENDRVVITRDGHLLISSARSRDEGIYTCRVLNRIGQARDTAVLQVVGVKGNTSAPDIRQEFVTLNISRNVGDEVTFTCLLSDGVPKPTITWTKDNIVLRTTLRVKVDDVGVLKIFDIRKEDAGNYRCVAENSVDRVIIDTTLLVREMPEVNLPPITPHVDPGQSIELTCEASGTPKPRIEWLLNNAVIDADGEQIIIENNQLIVNRAGPADAGEYTCLAINVAGQASHSIKIEVQENDAPVITVPPTSQILLVGTSLVLDCRAKGTPEVVMEWRRNSMELDPNRDNVVIDNFPGLLQSLTIDKVQESDSGRYSCYAYNSFGTVEYEVEVFVTKNESCIPTSSESPLTATGIPTVNRTSPSGGNTVPLGPIYEGNQIRAASGHTVVLNCTTSVSPSDHLNHVWLHNNLDVDVDSDRYTSMNNGTLIIVGVGTEDSGSYECLFSLNRTVVSNAFQLSVSTKVLFNVKFSIQPKNQTVLAGSTSVITCTATSNNQPVETRWYFNDELVSDSGIFIKEMTSISDSGEYVCFVGSKEYSNSAYLNVQAIPSFIKRPADVLIYEQDPPSNVTLECQAEGVPKPTITWYMGNQSLENNFNLRLGQLQIVTSDGVENLIILPPYAEDLTGKYTCVVENDVGRIQSSATVQMITSDESPSVSSCDCQMKTRQRRIVIGNCVSFNEHNENYCEGFCQTSVYPAYTSTEDARKCCSAGADSVKSVILMRCNDFGTPISKAVEVDAIRSCECHLC